MCDANCSKNRHPSVTEKVVRGSDQKSASPLFVPPSLKHGSRGPLRRDERDQLPKSGKVTRPRAQEVSQGERAAGRYPSRYQGYCHATIARGARDQPGPKRRAASVSGSSRRVKSGRSAKLSGWTLSRSTAVIV